LEAFLAAAEAGTMRAAASAMNLTVSAVSHRIQMLEAEVGLELFERRGQTIRLTAAGVAFRDDLLPGIRILERATDNLAKITAGQRIKIATYPLFYSNWVTPRLGGFIDNFPDACIELLSIDSRRADDADIVIRSVFDPSAPLRAGEVKLFGWQGKPICHPDFLKRNNILEPDDLRRATLISLETFDLWPRWFAAAGLQPPLTENRLVVDSQALMYDAAMQQLGVAISTTFFGQHYLKLGLVWPFDLTCDVPGGMYIGGPKQGESEIVTRFRTWIVGEVERTRVQMDSAE